MSKRGHQVRYIDWNNRITLWMVPISVRFKRGSRIKRLAVETRERTIHHRSGNQSIP